VGARGRGGRRQGRLRVGDRSIAFTEHTKPGEVDWAAHGVDIVLECSGKFRTPEQLTPYFDKGVKKVIVAAPVKGGDAHSTSSWASTITFMTRPSTIC
jgi:glyceraldehyde 3-phosphate dehydrogenase